MNDDKILSGEDAVTASVSRLFRSHEALRARLADTEDALREYAHHNGSCRYSGMHWTPGMEGGSCSCGLDAALGEQEGAEDDPMPEAPDLDVVTGDGSGVALPPYDPENPGPHVADARKSRITVANEPRDDS